MIKKHIILCLIVVIAFQSQYVPIPKTYPGLFEPISNPSGQVQLTFICDPMCEDCHDWTFGTFIPALQKIPIQVVKQKIGYRLIPFAKPAHITAHKLVQACIYIEDKFPGQGQGIKSFYHFLNNTQNWNESKLNQQTISQWMGRVADYISDFPNIDRQDVLKQLAHGSKTEAKARQWFKHIVGTTVTSYTPTLYINGAKLDNLMNIDANSLYKIINDLIE